MDAGKDTQVAGRVCIFGNGGVGFAAFVFASTCPFAIHLDAVRADILQAETPVLPAAGTVGDKRAAIDGATRHAFAVDREVDLFIKVRVPGNEDENTTIAIDNKDLIVLF